MINEGLFPNESIFEGDKPFWVNKANIYFFPFSNPELDRAKCLADNGVTYNMMVVFNYCVSSYRITVDSVI